MREPPRTARPAARQHVVDRGAELARAASGGPGGVQGDRPETRHLPERGDLLLQQDRVLVLHQAESRRPPGQQRGAAPEVHPQRHHQGLAQRIDRRVGHLREALPEEGIDRRRAPRQWRDRRVVTHAPHGILPGRRHRLQHVAQILEAPAEGELAGGQIGGVGRRGGGLRRGGTQPPDAAPGPARVRLAPRHLALRLGVRRIAWRRVSTTSSSPGPTRPASTTSRGSKSTRPASDPATTRPSAVIW